MKPFEGFSETEDLEALDGSFGIGEFDLVLTGCNVLRFLTGGGVGSFSTFLGIGSFGSDD